MKKQRYIKANNLPPRPSILTFLVWWLILERFNAPAWLYGALYVLLGMLFIVEVWRMFACDAVDLIGNDTKD